MLQTTDMETLSWYELEEQVLRQAGQEVISETESYLRPPETEIYGRSLSTIRRLGALMVRQELPEVIVSPEAAQAKTEFYTSVEEGFGTDIELGGGLEVRDFDQREVINGRVMSKDLKTAVSDMTEAGLKCAARTAEKDDRFRPQLTRSEWDHKNALIVDEMARAETGYNTRVVITPFPEEAAAQSGNEYWRNIGYVPHLRRGFVQLYHFNGEEVVAGSLSFDGSNKQQLRGVLGEHDVDIPEGEITDNWLQYAITGTFTEEEAKALATRIAEQAGEKKHKKTTNTVDITHEHGLIMERVFNESYVHICESLVRGRQTEGARELVFNLANKAQSFKKRYAHALYKMRADKHEFTDNDAAVLHELLVYSTIEMMRAFHLENKYTRNCRMHANGGSIKSVNVPPQLFNPSLFQAMLGGFGAIGAQNGRAYSACGLAISAGEERDTETPQDVFAGVDASNESSRDNTSNTDSDDADCEFTSKQCPECGAKNVKTLVQKISSTHKRISGSCGCEKVVG